MGFSSMVVCSYYWPHLLFDVTALLLIFLGTFLMGCMFYLKLIVMRLRYITLSFLLLAFLIAFPESLDAQCPMCKISAESNLKAGGTAGQGLNKGIMYLFFTPYLVIGGLAFLWWKNRKVVPEDEGEIQFEER